VKPDIGAYAVRQANKNGEQAGVSGPGKRCTMLGIELLSISLSAFETSRHRKTGIRPDR
jgi:hypothetical protein